MQVVFLLQNVGLLCLLAGLRFGPIAVAAVGQKMCLVKAEFKCQQQGVIWKDVTGFSWQGWFVVLGQEK